ncbi:MULTISPECIES: F0F1 ATP synthase subunit epsilon [Gemella]|uniref:F0F1 ATP synthase subunit epsilon n=1 Tax=Gemella TaxID=1378 RepID=UPI0007681E89|nr:MULTISPECIES: F0F1 ATP synthase subunit epsilon [Gemella]AME09987.1 ATP synthase F0F1 subunit epsilon [Gemella sp. oral taxon 928]AXI26126.1 F0F1 ATP synthase subunit epsilon [Gemella sp. ND 6198]
MNTLNVSIVTPNGEVYSTKNASMVVLGTTSGQLGIMANHVPMVVSLAIGPLKVAFPDGKEERIAVSEGFVETHKNDITVIVQTAECADDIDVERAKRAKERAEKRLSERKSTLDVRRAELALARALARLKVTEK